MTYELKSVTKFTARYNFVTTEKNLAIGEKVLYKGKKYIVTRVIL